MTSVLLGTSSMAAPRDSGPHLQRPPPPDPSPSVTTSSTSRGASPYKVSSQRSAKPPSAERPGGEDPEPGPGGDFSVVAVEGACEAVLVERLQDLRYDPATCRHLSQELAAAIMERIKRLRVRRHKLVAVVSIGSLKERTGLQFGSRCLWNQQTDSFATVKFTNNSLFAVAMVYGLYFD